jgi:hypothetical protein
MTFWIADICVLNVALVVDEKMQECSKTRHCEKCICDCVLSEVREF